MCYKGPLQLHRGSWAGDRFYVRPFDDVIESMKDEGDLTRTATRDIYTSAEKFLSTFFQSSY